MKFKNLNIIGGGPNCVYAIEILLKKILSIKDKKKRHIRIFEKSGLIGSGKTHSINLSKNILLNRVAGQISLGSYPFLKFPKNLSKFDYNFMDWKNKQSEKEIRNLKSTDWPSRFIFGLSLRQKMLDLLKIYLSHTNVTIEIYFDEIVSINKKKKIEIITKENKKFESDKLLIATGNYLSSDMSTKLNKEIKELTKKTNASFEYNFIENLDKKKYWRKFSMNSILIFGTGVSSLDVISMLSKKKNKIFPISRTFLFPFARPLNQKLKNPKKLEHTGILLNKDLIKNISLIISKNRKNEKFNYKYILLPFIKSEFYLIYFKNYLSKKNFSNFKLFVQNKLSIKNKKKIDLINESHEIDEYLRNFLIKKNLKKNFYVENWFSQKKILDKISYGEICFFDIFANPLMYCKKNFTQEYLKFLDWDIKEAKKGNLSSPFKKACDGLWRDLRPLFTKLFDDCKNKKIYDEFIINILPIHNRLADGPSLEMIKEIKRLILKKVISFKYKDEYKFKKIGTKLFIFNDNYSNKIDYIFSAIANIYKEQFKSDNLMQSMFKNNLVSLKKNNFSNRQFLNLSKLQNPINEKNLINKDITFIGPASEGSKFFHHTLSRPDKKQFNIIDLEKWVSNL